MFDLERELGKWRQAMAATGLAPEILIELEEHLREDIERQVRSGTNVPEALQAALQRIGQPSALRNEFDLVRQPGVAETVRRHKWKLLLCCGAGLLAAIVLHVLRPAPYQSEAKLFVRTVAPRLLTLGLDQPITIQSIASSYSVAELTELQKIMIMQVEILTSLDLARRVAETIGPNKILKKTGGSKAGGREDLIRATVLIRGGLQVAVPAKSSVIHIAFRHPDSDVVQTVLREVIDQFFKMHIEVRRAAGDRAAAIGRVANISKIQTPSPPYFDFAALFRMQALVVAAGVVTGLAWVLVVRSTGASLKLAR